MMLDKFCFVSSGLCRLFECAHAETIEASRLDNYGYRLGALRSVRAINFGHYGTVRSLKANEDINATLIDYQGNIVAGLNGKFVVVCLSTLEFALYRFVQFKRSVSA
jgi:hypothetical protein